MAVSPPIFASRLTSFAILKIQPRTRKVTAAQNIMKNRIAQAKRSVTASHTAITQSIADAASLVDNEFDVRVAQLGQNLKWRRSEGTRNVDLWMRDIRELISYLSKSTEELKEGEAGMSEHVRAMMRGTLEKLQKGENR